MTQSTQRAVSDGTLVSLDLSIHYIDRSEITVYFDSVLTTAWEWLGETAKQITFSTAVPNGVEVLVKRTTDISKLRHEFSKGAAFTAEVLDEDLKQVLHIAQEASETNMSGQFYSDIDMHNYRVRNIGTAVDDTDALTLGQYKADTLGASVSKTAAAASASAAAGSATDAAASASAAAGSATDAAASATASAGSATAAAGSAATAGTHATDAWNSANAAANSASAAATSATNATNASRLTVGTVTTGTQGSAAAVTISGEAGAQTVSFTIPRGDVGATGPANTIAIGTVTTGAAGASAAASITGTSPNQTLNLTIPQGIQGPRGEIGPQGPAGPASPVGAGTVQFFAVPSAPTGWLKANGAQVSRTTYASLFTTIGTTFGAGDGSTTFNLPDLRGEFLRGFDDGRGVDSGRAFGSLQRGSIVPYQGYADGRHLTAAWASYLNDRLGWVGGLYDDGFEGNHTNGIVVTDYGVTPSIDWQGQFLGGQFIGGSGVGTTNLLKGTRPRNVALLACIKF